MEKTVAGWVGKDERKDADADDAVAPDDQTFVDLLPESKYRVIREIAQGEISRILEIEHVELRRVCAAKVLRRPFATDERLADALVQEGRILASVRHHNVVEVIDVGRHASDGAFLVLELLHGRALDAELLNRGHLPVEEALQVVDGLLAGLSALHEANIVHRSLDPSHVFLARDARGQVTVKLLGLAMARRLRSPESQVTDIGELEGAQAFAAPELRDPELGLVDRRSDLFSVGALLYLMISGNRPPAVGATEPAPPVTSPAEPVPPWVVAMVARALNANRSVRFARAEDMRAELRGGAADEPARHEFEETTTLERAPDAISAKIRLERGARIAMAPTMMGPLPGVVSDKTSPTGTPSLGTATPGEATPLPAAVPAGVASLELPAVLTPQPRRRRGFLVVVLLGALLVVAFATGTYLSRRPPGGPRPRTPTAPAAPTARAPEPPKPTAKPEPVEAAKPEPVEPAKPEPVEAAKPEPVEAVEPVPAPPIGTVAKPASKAPVAAKPTAAKPVVRRPIFRRKVVAKTPSTKKAVKKPAAPAPGSLPPPRTGIRGSDF